MAKAAIARHYIIEYTVPHVNNDTRTMTVTARFPSRELARFRRVNPKAVVSRMYDKHTNETVSIDQEQNSKP